MLNLEEIAQRIAQPEISRVEDIDDLKLFSDKYPYCQLFPILYLKALAQHNDIRFEEELTKYAYCISDRSQLYALIHTEKQHSQIEIESIEAPIYSIVPEPILEIVESPTVEETIVSEPTIEREETVVETEELAATIETPIEIPAEIPLDNHIIEPSNTPIVTPI
jgi:hypothetical protein